jgi:hypothetical protein
MLELLKLFPKKLGLTCLKQSSKTSVKLIKQSVVMQAAAKIEYKQITGKFIMKAF